MEELLRMSWHLFVRNEEVAALTGLSSLSDIICRRRSAIFWHIARFGEEVPAHKALRNYISLSLGCLPDLSWRRRPGRPRGTWIDQLRRDNSQPPADLWRQAINRGQWKSDATVLGLCDYLTWPDLLRMWRGRQFQVVAAATAKLREPKHVRTRESTDRTALKIFGQIHTCTYNF